MLATLATYKRFWSKFTASRCVMCVTLIRLPLNMKLVTNIIYLLADLCIFLKCFDYFVLTNSFSLGENPKFAFIL